MDQNLGGGLRMNENELQEFKDKHGHLFDDLDFEWWEHYENSASLASRLFVLLYAHRKALAQVAPAHPLVCESNFIADDGGSFMPEFREQVAGFLNEIPPEIVSNFACGTFSTRQHYDWLMKTTQSHATVAAKVGVPSLEAEALLPILSSLWAGARCGDVGAKAIFAQAAAELSKRGFEVINPDKGEAFDVNQHYVIRVDGEGKSITEVVEPGLRYGEAVISTAKVAV